MSSARPPLPLPLTFGTKREFPLDGPSSLSHTWSNHYNARSPSSPSPACSSPPPMTPFSATHQHNFAHIRSSPRLAFEIGLHDPAYPSDYLPSAWGRNDHANPAIKSPATGYKLPSFHSAFPSDDEPPFTSDFDTSEFSEDADVDIVEYSPDNQSDVASGHGSVFFSDSEDEDQDQDTGYSFVAEDPRATYFTTSAERGRWKSDPLPFQTRLRSSAPTACSTSTVHLVPRPISEPAPPRELNVNIASALLDFHDQLEARQGLPSPKSARQGSPEDSSIWDSDPPQTIPSLSSDRDSEPDDQCPTSPLPPSSPPLSPMSFASLSPMIGPVSPISLSPCPSSPMPASSPLSLALDCEDLDLACGADEFKLGDDMAELNSAVQSDTLLLIKSEPDFPDPTPAPVSQDHDLMSPPEELICHHPSPMPSLSSSNFSPVQPPAPLYCPTPDLTSAQEPNESASIAPALNSLETVSLLTSPEIPSIVADLPTVHNIVTSTPMLEPTATASLAQTSDLQDNRMDVDEIDGSMNLGVVMKPEVAEDADSSEKGVGESCAENIKEVPSRAAKPRVKQKGQETERRTRVKGMGANADDHQTGTMTEKLDVVKKSEKEKKRPGVIAPALPKEKEKEKRKKKEDQYDEGPLTKKSRTSSSSVVGASSSRARTPLKDKTKSADKPVDIKPAKSSGKRKLDAEKSAKLDTNSTSLPKSKKQKREGGEEKSTISKRPRPPQTSQSDPVLSTSASTSTSKAPPRASTSALPPTAPVDPETSALDAEICGMLIESMATSRASSLPTTSLYKAVMQSRPALKAQRSEKEWMVVFDRVLHDGEGGKGSGVFGKVESSGKDESNRPLEAQWFYVPERDQDQDRASLIRSMMPRPGKRTETKKYKQYYYRPLDKISRWDPEDEI